MGRIILEGFMGCGKTTCGRTLAQEFLLTFVDTDQEIEKSEGMSVSEIFEKRGEGYFRDLETGFLKSLSGTDKFANGVIALGGGMIVREENRRLLKLCGTVVYLKASPELLKERLRSRFEKRPLLKEGNTDEKVDRLLSEREALYLEAADSIIEVDGLVIYQIVNKLKAIYNRM